MIKSDILIMIIGTSPMPNLIGVCTRIKNNGKVIMIHTNETKIIANNLEKLIEKKNRDKDTEINTRLEAMEFYDDPAKVYEELSRALNNVFQEFNLLNNPDKVIELNFTGGTKVMSSIAYSIFKSKFENKNENALLTYLDGEKSQINILNLKNHKECIISYSKSHETLPITIDDIVSLHFELDNTFPYKKEEPEIDPINEKIYGKVIENLENRQEYIHFLNSIYEEVSDNKNKEWDVNLDTILRNSRIKLEGYSDFKSLLASYEDTYPDLKKKKINKTIRWDLAGGWLENILFKILLGWKEKDLIDDVVNSLERKKNIDNHVKFEVDLIVLKNHQLYCISVTTIENYDEAKFKLYEIKARAKSLGGVEAKVAFISFCENSKELKMHYKNIWEDDLRETLIISWDEFNNIEGLLEKWICGGV